VTASKILIVNDDARQAGVLAGTLALEGFGSEVLSSDAALSRLSRHSFDLVILDVIDGLPFLRRVRMRSRMPVLMLTRPGRKEEGIRGLELGADDYLSQPFGTRELVARLRAVLRRSEQQGQTSLNPLTLGELAIDPEAKSATMEGVPVRLTTAEFLVLDALARSAGRVQSRATLTRRALGRRIEPFDRSIDTHISNIRRKLCLDPRRGIEIKSFRGHGYVLTVSRTRKEG